MKRIFTFLMASAFVVSASAQDCSELFISEYVEGTHNNKALEIYNPTAASVDLSDYFVTRYSNGSNTAKVENSIQLSGTLAAYDVYVATLDKQDPLGTGQDTIIFDELRAVTDGYYCPDYNTSNAFYFNGNDAVVLYKGTLSSNGNDDVSTLGATVVDIFGKIGEDPGVAWTTDFPHNSGVGTYLTKDHSLIRKSTIKEGVTSPVISFFNALDQWDSIPPFIMDGGNEVGNWGSLGSHDCGCTPASIEENGDVSFSIFPNPSNGVFTISVNEQIKTMEIVAVDGRLIQSQNNIQAGVSTKVVIEEEGMFIIKLISSNGNAATRRVVIRK